MNKAYEIFSDDTFEGEYTEEFLFKIALKYMCFL